MFDKVHYTYFTIWLWICFDFIVLNYDCWLYVSVHCLWSSSKSFLYPWHSAQIGFPLYAGLPSLILILPSFFLHIQHLGIWFFHRVHLIKLVSPKHWYIDKWTLSYIIGNKTNHIVRIIWKTYMGWIFYVTSWISKITF